MLFSQCEDSDPSGADASLLYGFELNQTSNYRLQLSHGPGARGCEVQPTLNYLFLMGLAIYPQSYPRLLRNLRGNLYSLRIH